MGVNNAIQISVYHFLFLEYTDSYRILPQIMQSVRYYKSNMIFIKLQFDHK